MQGSRTAVLLIVLAFASTSCSDKGKTESEDDSHTHNRGCHRLLGEAGLDWVKKSSGVNALSIKSGHTLEESSKKFSKYARNWKPNPVWSSAPSVEVCSIRKEKSKKRLHLEYGASMYKFDWVTDDRKPGDAVAYTTWKVNSDVKLDYKKSKYGYNVYNIYIRCQVSGAGKEQLENVPMHGAMVDDLVKDSDQREHFNYLLHSARAAVGVFECQNHPRLPAGFEVGD